MTEQRKTNTAFSATPFRAYARDAVSATQEDTVSAVLKERIAERLAGALRTYLGRPSATLADLQPNERTWCLTEATVIVLEVEAIRSTKPPTVAEVRHVEARRELQAAQRLVRCDATRLGHVLGSFRPAPVLAGYVEAFCEACGGGVRIHTMSAQVSASTVLERACGGGR